MSLIPTDFTPGSSKWMCTSQICACSPKLLPVFYSRSGAWFISHLYLVKYLWLYGQLGVSSPFHADLNDDNWTGSERCSDLLSNHFAIVVKKRTVSLDFDDLRGSPFISYNLSTSTPLVLWLNQFRTWCDPVKMVISSSSRYNIYLHKN